MSTKEKGIVPIIFAIDDKYAPLLHVTLRSIIAQASPDYTYNIHILHDGLTEENIKSFDIFKSNSFKIFLNDISDMAKKYAETMHYKYYYSNSIYYRAFIPELFPEYDKALYLDSDIVLNSDVSELYNYDLEDNYVGAVTCETVNTNPIFTAYAENFLGLKLPYYFNSGVILMNCKKLREVEFKKQFFEVANSYKLEICPDQDYYNLLCHGKTKFLPGVWNKIPRVGSKEKLEEIKLVHYNLSGKPWRYSNILYEDLFWKYAKETIMYDKILKIKDSMTDADRLRDKQRVEALMAMAKDLATRKEDLIESIEKRNGESKIPKKIHYIWVGGGEFTPKMIACKESWIKHCPDFEIIEWNEKNFDMSKCPLIKEAYEKKNYALVSDMMRVHILNENGGIYVDTDIEILKPLDRFMQHEFFIGYESKFWVNTAIIGGVKGHPVFKTLANLCSSPHCLKITNLLSVHMWSAVLAELYNIKGKGKTRMLDNGVGIYSKEWFYPIHYITRKKVILPNTHTIHYYSGTWGNEKDLKKFNFWGKTFAWYFNSPLFRPIEHMAAGIYRSRINGLLKKCKADNEKS